MSNPLTHFDAQGQAQEKMGGPGEPFRVGVKKEDGQGQGRKFESQGIDEIGGPHQTESGEPYDQAYLPYLDPARREI